MTPQKFNKRRPMCVLNSSESRLDSSASMKNMKKKLTRGFLLEKNYFFSMNATGIFIVSSHWSENVLTRHTKEGKKLIIIHTGPTTNFFDTTRSRQ